jgi:hypothetical protein
MTERLTVRELIEQLSRLPKDCVVMRHDADWTAVDVREPEVLVVSRSSPESTHAWDVFDTTATRSADDGDDPIEVVVML